jgi:predicted ester cyclase
MDLAERYRTYLDCLNGRRWDELADHVDPEVVHNGEVLGLAGYRRMLERDVTDIPDLRFQTELLVVAPPYVAARLDFRCTPRGRFLGLDVDGRAVSFAENVFYRYRGERIAQVWSVIDKAGLEAQLATPG